MMMVVVMMMMIMRDYSLLLLLLLLLLMMMMMMLQRSVMARSVRDNDLPDVSNRLRPVSLHLRRLYVRLRTK